MIKGKRLVFKVGNYVEAGLWVAIGIAFAVHFFIGKDRSNKISLVAFVTFIAFGLSDVVEVSTGAWWRPWWLLVWKGMCVVSMLRLFLHWRKRAG